MVIERVMLVYLCVRKKRRKLSVFEHIMTDVEREPDVGLLIIANNNSDSFRSRTDKRAAISK